MSDKIVHHFQQRRQLEQTIHAFAQTTSLSELIAAAQQVAHNFPSDLVLTVLLKYLDTNNSQIRGGLGHLAALLPQDVVTTALRTVTANRQQSPLARTTAMTIAQRFLGIDFPSALIDDLSNTDEAAVQSLRDALAESKHNRHILLEYVEQMRELGEEIAFLVLSALDRLPAPDRVDILRLIAQDSRVRVAREALAHLERLASGEASAAALRALHTLTFSLSPELSPAVERSLRKLRMAGWRHDPPPPTHWRALISPAESTGSQAVWLVYRPEDSGAAGILLGFSLNLGALNFFGGDRLDQAVLPAPQPIGQVLTVLMDRGQRAVMLEIPLDVGRWLIQQGIAAHWQHNPTLTLPGECQLYNDLIWEWAAPTVDEAFARLWQPAESEPAQVDEEKVQKAVDDLFAHPVMAGWALQGRAVVQAIQPASRPNPNLPLAEVIPLLLREIAQWPESASLSKTLACGLRGQATWLHFTGNPHLTQQALILAQASERLPLARNPVLAHMLAAGLNA
jgi:hypothetical protein